MGLEDGATTVTVTATDPGELMGERMIDVRVLEPVLIFRDDFDIGTWDWAFNFYVRFFYRDGLLHMGLGQRRTRGGKRLPDQQWMNVAEWEYRASVGVEEGGEDVERYLVGLISAHYARRSDLSLGRILRGVLR